MVDVNRCCGKKRHPYLTSICIYNTLCKHIIFYHMLEFSIICRSAESLDKINNILWSVKTKYDVSVDYSGSMLRSFLVGGSDSAPPGAWFGLLNPPSFSFFSCFVCYPSNDWGLVLVLSTNIENVMLVVDSPTRTN